MFAKKNHKTFEEMSEDVLTSNRLYGYMQGIQKIKNSKLLDS